MNDLDDRLARVLDRLVPRAVEADEWEDVLARLEASSVEAAASHGAGSPPEEAPRRIRPSRPVLVLALLGLLLVAAAVAGTLVLTRGSGKAAEVEPTRVLARVQRALEDADALVLHETTRFDDGATEESWADPPHHRSRAMRYDAAGNLVLQRAISIEGHTLRSDVVDYANRTWRTTETELPPNVPLEAMMTAGSQYMPAFIRKGLEQTRFSLYSVVGRETLDGRETLHLRTRAVPALGPGTDDLWVDASTYLPVKEIDTRPRTARNIELEWLPRNAETLRQTELVKPEGFAHSSASYAVPTLPAGGPVPSAAGSTCRTVKVRANGVVTVWRLGCQTVPGG